jgi:bifunctional non-homologous end joining protein LigD
MSTQILGANVIESGKVQAILNTAKIEDMPENIEPMLATLVNEPVEEKGWLYEMKWDGYRAVGYINNGTVNICSRNNKSFNKKYYPLYTALKEWNIDAVVDGEIVVVNEEGIPDFGNLQLWRSGWTVALLSLRYIMAPGKISDAFAY